MTLRIASWNVNSVKARIELITGWLASAAPDIACLQELKCEDDAFPAEPFEALGYACAVHGQKSWNGVAILSKLPLSDVMRGLPGDETDAQSRYIEAVASLPGGGAIRVASIYLPNGNPADTPKYPYKLAWIDRLTRHAAALLAHEERLVLAGDYNVIPDASDVANPDAWRDDALFRLETRRAFRGLTGLGFTDAFRAVDDAAQRYTFWDYQAGAWQKNKGLRIDHLLISPQAADRLTDCSIDKSPRALERPSDHTPIIVELAV